MASMDPIKHAKRKWDLELKEWNRLLDHHMDIERQMKLQRDRIHKAYLAYIKLKGHP